MQTKSMCLLGYCRNYFCSISMVLELAVIITRTVVVFSLLSSLSVRTFPSTLRMPSTAFTEHLLYLRNGALSFIYDLEYGLTPRSPHGRQMAT